MEEYWNGLSYYLRRKLVSEYELDMENIECTVTFKQLDPYKRVSLYHKWNSSIKFTKKGNEIVKKHRKKAAVRNDKLKKTKQNKNKNK